MKRRSFLAFLVGPLLSLGKVFGASGAFTIKNLSCDKISAGTLSVDGAETVVSRSFSPEENRAAF